MTDGERGEVSIISVLVACILLVAVLGATLSLFEGFVSKAGDASRRTDSQDAARTAADRIARNLRNLANPTSGDPMAVDRATATDLIFKSVNPAGPAAGTNSTNTQRVRYCLDGARQLHQQTQNWSEAVTPPAPTTVACPGTGWPISRVIAANVANTSEPVFVYDAATTAVHVDLLVDADPTRPPGATRLSTGVFLRNQNRRPTAAFSATRTAGGFVLDGSASADPEGDTLEYEWYDGGVRKGTGITFTYRGLAAGSLHQLSLRVIDPAGLDATSATQGVTA